MPALRERGAVLPLVAISLAVLMGFGGMAMDIGFWEYKYQAQQAATDAAARGGAEQQYAEGCQSGSDAEAAATGDASINGYTTGGNVTVTPVANPSSGPYANNQCAVSVTITNSQPSFLSRFVGVNSMWETTQAVGLASQNNPGCIWLLIHNKQSNFSNSHINVPGCDIYDNGNANYSNSSINAAYIGNAQSGSNISGASFPGATPQPMQYVSDPCQHMPGCAYLAANPPSISPCSPGAYAGGPVNGGCYSTLQLPSNGTVQVCGLIVVTNQLQMAGGVTVNTCSSGVTFYLTNTANTLNFSGGNTVLNLTAPATGNTRGVVMYRDPRAANSVNFSAGTNNIAGLLYFPTADVNYSSSTSAYANLVFGSANFSTSTGVTLASPPPNGTIAIIGTLVQ